jgi:hypothetical protein
MLAPVKLYLSFIKSGQFFIFSKIIIWFHLWTMRILQCLGLKWHAQFFLRVWQSSLTSFQRRRRIACLLVLIGITVTLQWKVDFRAV